MKKCKKFEETKELHLFPTVKGEPYTYCKECKRILQREWIRNKRQNSKVRNKYK